MYDGLQSLDATTSAGAAAAKNTRNATSISTSARKSSPRPARRCRRAIAEDPGRDRGHQAQRRGERGRAGLRGERITPGITTEQIDQWVHDYTVEHGAIPAPLDYGLPEVGVAPRSTRWSATASPLQTRCCARATSSTSTAPPLKTASSPIRPACSASARCRRRRADLVRVTKEAVQVGLDAIKPWGHLGDIGAAVNAYAREHGYTVVREFGGPRHRPGVHEDPLRELRHGSRHWPHSRAGALFHHRAHDQRRCPGDRHDRPQRLDGAHRRSVAHSPMGRSNSSSPRTVTNCSAGKREPTRQPPFRNGGGNFTVAMRLAARSDFGAGRSMLTLRSTKNPFSERSFSHDREHQPNP